MPRLLLHTVVFSTLAQLAFVDHLAGAAETDRPNIIFLLTDDQRWDTLGSMGNPIIETPNVDRLAEGGVVFDRCFVTTSICMTNRACIFTGQYAARHGIWSFRTNFTDDQLAHTYPGVLKKAGYCLGFIGKWGVGKPPEALFDYNEGWPGQNRYYPTVKREELIDSFGAYPGPDQLPQGTEGEPKHLTSIMGDQAIEFLDRVPDDRPFCLSFSFKSPHCQDGFPFCQFHYDTRLGALYRDATIAPPPLSAPAFFDALPEFLKVSENRRRWEVRFATPEMHGETVKAYYRLITGVDRVVGRIVEKLEREGLDENTIILYTGDNGFYLGERGFAGKWFPHEVSIRVPLVVYDPRLQAGRRGARCDEMALSIDLGPTMLEMAGVDVPERMQGRSLVPLVAGEKPDWRTEFFYEHLFEHKTIPRSEAVRGLRTKYIRFVDSEPLYEELFDLESDPHEAHNLAGRPEHARTLDRMRKKWAAWRERVK
ncbi:MAG: sulfatase family protein [Planctomycetota bacterium]|jgi:arylsulfatase A-like enzyme